MPLHHISGAGLLAALALTTPARAGELDRYLPVDSEVVVNVNVRQLLDSSLVKKHALELAREALRGVEMADEILKDLGFDPFKDLDRVLYASPTAAEKDRGLLIARGKFDRAKFKAKAEEAARTNSDVLKVRKVPDGSGGHHLIYEVQLPDSALPFFVALADGNTLLASPGKDYVVDALKRVGVTEKPALKDRELQALLEKVDEKQTVSLAAVSAALQKGVLADAPEEAAEVLGKITAVGGGVTLAEDVKVEVVVTTKNAADAREFRDSADKGLKLALALLAGLSQGEANPGIELALEVVKGLKVSAKDRAIVIKGRVAADVIDEALKKDK
jgi:hypothetical protein